MKSQCRGQRFADAGNRYPVAWSSSPSPYGFLLLCCLLAAFLPACDRRQQAPPPPPVPEVSYITVAPEKIMLDATLPGRTAAYRSAAITPQVSGLIQKRLFEEGTDVKAGQILYLIDPAPYQAAMDNAAASLIRAEAKAPALRARTERYKESLEARAVSKQDYDDAVSTLKQAEADIVFWQAAKETARINLEYTKVTAPISGRIGKSLVTDGAIVTAYQPTPLATIQQLDPIHIDVPQSTATLLRLQNRVQQGILNTQGKNQNKVTLILEDGAKYPLEGTLQFSDVTVDGTTGSVILRALFPNPEGLLLPGMFVRAKIQEGMNEQAILIPQQGVSRDPKGNPYTLVIDGENKTAMRQLTLERAIGSRWLVTKGLAAGDKVIVEGPLLLRPGTEVKAVPFDAAKKDSPPAAPTGTQPAPQSKGGA